MVYLLQKCPIGAKRNRRHSLLHIGRSVKRTFWCGRFVGSVDAVISGISVFSVITGITLRNASMAITALFTGSRLLSSLMLLALLVVTVPFRELHLLRTPPHGERQISTLKMSNFTHSLHL